MRPTVDRSAAALLSVLCLGPGLAACSDAGGGGDAARPADLSTPGAPDLATRPQSVTLRYVTDAITLPRARTEYAADLNGDGKPENRFGEIIGVLASQQIDLQAEENSTIAMGDGLALVSLSTLDPTATTDDAARLTLYAAEPTAGAPDFSGAGTFIVDRSVAGGVVIGPIAAGQYRSLDPLTLTDPPTVYLRLVLGPGVTVAMPLVGARVRVVAQPTRLLSGVLNGAMRKTDIDAILVPGLATSLDRIAHASNCARGTPCAKVKELFDANVDGTVSLDEVRASALVQALLMPDVDLLDTAGAWKPNADNTDPDSVSVGVAFTAVKASFVEP